MDPIAIIADIHGNLLALRAVAADIARRGITTVANLGDHASGPLWPRETLEFLIEQPWLQIAGNHDRQLVRLPPAQHGLSDQYAFAQITEAQKEWLAALPATATLPGDILLCHGTPSNDLQYCMETVEHGIVRRASPAEIRERLAGTRASLLACGHTHMPRLIQHGQEMLILNPGSVGLQAYTDDTPEVHSMETGAPQARYAIVEHSAHGWQVTLVAVPYNHLEAAEQAWRNGRLDWEAGLRTGYISR